MILLKIKFFLKLTLRKTGSIRCEDSVPISKATYNTLKELGVNGRWRNFESFGPEFNEFIIQQLQTVRPFAQKNEIWSVDMFNLRFRVQNCKKVHNEAVGIMESTTFWLKYDFTKSRRRID